MRFFGRKRQPAQTDDALAPVLTKIEGDPELEFLFITPPAEEIVRALEAWKWLGLEGRRPILVSAFGEIFFANPDGAIVQLDTIEGRLKAVAHGVVDLTAQLQSEEARDDLLLAGLVIGARHRGLILGPDECYDFRIAPALGGEMTGEAVEKMFFSVKVHIAGQLHEQIKDLPPGTRINRVTIEE